MDLRDRRRELNEVLCRLLGSRNVYYEPPETIKMEYPAIIYSRSRISGRFAGNAAYFRSVRYELTVVDRAPDNPVIGKLLELPYCSYDRHYAADNLNHDVLTLYF